MSEWHDALELVWANQRKADTVPAPFSESRHGLQAALDQLWQVADAAGLMRTEPRYAHTPIGDLHDVLARQFPDVPTSICSDILRTTLNPRF